MLRQRERHGRRALSQAEGQAEQGQVLAGRAGGQGAVLGREPSLQPGHCPSLVPSSGPGSPQHTAVPVSSAPVPAVKTKDVSKQCQMFPRGSNHPLLRTTDVSQLSLTATCSQKASQVIQHPPNFVYSKQTNLFSPLPPTSSSSPRPAL